MTVMYPLAMTSNGPVHISDADHTAEYSCLGCNRPLIPHLGDRLTHHFAHMSLDSDCNPETALHETSKYYIHSAWVDAVRLSRECSVCHETINLECVGSHFLLEYSAVPNTRSDLVLMGADDKPLCLVEVVVSHEIDPATIQRYAESRIPIVRVYPKWTGMDVDVSDVRFGMYDGDCPGCVRKIDRDLFEAVDFQADCVVGLRNVDARHAALTREIRQLGDLREGLESDLAHSRAESKRLTKLRGLMSARYKNVGRSYV